MPVDLKGYRVFIASPGGLDDERIAFSDTIEEHNKSDGLARNIQFIPVGWEETLGGRRRPQSFINDEVCKCDYFVMVLYDRWGTPPGQNGDKKYSSGTEEEYHVAIECFKDINFPMRQIIIFFKYVDERRLSDPGEQLQKVLAFRKKLESEKTHLFHVYDTVKDFEKWLRKYLMQWVRDYESGSPAKVKHPIAPYDESAAQIREISKLEVPEKKHEYLEKEIKELLKKAEKLADEGKITEAETAYSEAVVRSNSPTAINAYGNFLLGLGRLDQAEVMYKRVKEIAENIGYEEWVSVALNNLGIIYEEQGDWVKAEEMHKKALKINERLGRFEGMAIQYGNLGTIYRKRSELNRAEEMHKKALEIDERIDNQKGIAQDYCGLGVVYYKCNKLNKAEEMYNKALEINKKLGILREMAENYCGLGNIYETRSDLVRSEEMHKKALEIHKKLGDQGGMAGDYCNLGIIHGMRNELKKAEEMYKKALEVAERMDYKEKMATSYGNLGNIYQKHGDLDKAGEMYSKALEIDERMGNQEGMAIDYGNLGAVYEKRGDLKRAEEYWLKSRDLFKKIGMPQMVKKMQGQIDLAGDGKK